VGLCSTSVHTHLGRMLCPASYNCRHPPAVEAPFAYHHLMEHGEHGEHKTFNCVPCCWAFNRFKSVAPPSTVAVVGKRITKHFPTEAEFLEHMETQIQRSA
jgi:hypothetical protein